ncbi:MAG: DUF167 domain-containing protein [Candidatus Aminicenantes bacterium]|nr:DUF167 domain-containing protein [Candidatus Aminicenantes bacterium]
MASSQGKVGRETKKIFTVKVQPKSSKQELVRISETEFRARLTSAPEKGKANEELLDLLADYLGVPPSSLRIIRGETSRTKLVEFTGPSR